MQPKINKTVLMSGTEYFKVKELNPYSHADNQPDAKVAKEEFHAIQAAIRQAGIEIISVDAPVDCQDGIFTANWGLCRGNTVIMSSLPEQRQAEEPYARATLSRLGKQPITPPCQFSGQGDALPCGNLLFAGSGYRNDPHIHQFLADTFGYEVISLHALPELDNNGRPVINKLTGLPDSFFYDIDLALAILRE